MLRPPHVVFGAGVRLPARFVHRRAVEATSPALIEKVRSVVTDGAGVYRIENLRPGTYAVTLRSPGYRDWHGTAATQPVVGCAGEFAPAVFRAWMVPR